MSTPAPIRNLTPQEVQDALDSGAIHLIDVREPHEYAQYAIAGSVSLPLSGFQPADLPDDGREIVFMCAAGVRSLRAIEISRALGRDVSAHMPAGIYGWINEGRPVQS